MLAGVWGNWRGSVRQACGSLQLPALLSYCSRTLVLAGRTLGAKCGTRSTLEPPITCLPVLQTKHPLQKLASLASGNNKSLTPLTGAGADGRRACRAESGGQGVIQPPDHGLCTSRHTRGQ